MVLSEVILSSIIIGVMGIPLGINTDIHIITIPSVVSLLVGIGLCFVTQK